MAKAEVGLHMYSGHPKDTRYDDGNVERYTADAWCTRLEMVASSAGEGGAAGDPWPRARRGHRHIRFGGIRSSPREDRPGDLDGREGAPWSVPARDDPEADERHQGDGAKKGLVPAPETELDFTRLKA